MLIKRLLVGFTLGLCGLCPVFADQTEPVEAQTAPTPQLQPLDWNTIRERSLAWITDRNLGEATASVDAFLPADGDPGHPQGRHVRVIAFLVDQDEQAAELLTALDPRQFSVAIPAVRAHLDQTNNAFYRTNLGIELVQRLADRRLYEEALDISQSLQLSDAVDPSKALFYRAVCEHQLLMREEGLKTIEQLLEADWPIAESYRSVAELMKMELESLKPDSLGEIAGIMNDVERRLKLARGGKRVQEREQEITQKFDEIIKKLEQQQQQQQQQSSSGGAGNQNSSNNPANESVVKGQTAPGEVDDKGKRRGGDWGNLPPKEREAAKSEIERAFPSNYGRLINEYFLKRTQEN